MKLQPQQHASLAIIRCFSNDCKRYLWLCLTMQHRGLSKCNLQEKTITHKHSDEDRTSRRQALGRVKNHQLVNSGKEKEDMNSTSRKAHNYVREVSSIPQDSHCQRHTCQRNISGHGALDKATLLAPVTLMLRPGKVKRNDKQQEETQLHLSITNLTNRKRRQVLTRWLKEYLIHKSSELS